MAKDQQQRQSSWGTDFRLRCWDQTIPKMRCLQVSKSFVVCIL
jgi:hypothetical protein